MTNAIREGEKIMRYTERIFLFLFILGVISVGCYLKSDFRIGAEKYTGPQTVDAPVGAFDARYSSHETTAVAGTPYGEKYHIIAASQTYPEVEDWIVIDETAVPKIPGVIYVQKTELTADIWHTSHTTARSENGERISIEGPVLSEKQKLHLLNTGMAPKGWDVVYIDGSGNPIR